ncbi:hypothetical protein HGRIS_010021 [Hohenbuehelia grisea]|uniref:Cytochrome c oxidase subunit 3 n=1 Tax=Hohenbuehelia grisea TaxID=104357 RepID=A0ABR3J323_9AGAR
MPLFRDNPVRSTGALAAALVVGYFISSFMTSMHAFHLTQTSVAILAISSLIFLVTMHHRREGHLLTQTQEELVLIGGFGLFFTAALLAWRALTHPGHGGHINLGSASGVTRHSGGGAVPPYPCSPNDIYCIEEEWTIRW